MKRHEIGKSFEDRWAEKVGGKVQPQSGAGKWARLDVLNMGGENIIWSCKATGSQSLTLSTYDLHEPISAAYSAYGIGGEATPALAVEIDGEPYVIQRADDWLESRTSDTKIERTSTKAEQRRKAAKTTPLMRDDE